jgi:hypothetical protein
MTEIILISGPRFVGKDTAADHLAANGFVKLALADTLKELISQMYDFPTIWCYTREGKTRHIRSAGGLTVGDLLQQVGTKIGRDTFPDLWCEKLARRIRSLGLRKVVIPDCRFENEFLFFKNFDGPKAEQIDGSYTACFVIERKDAEAEARRAGDTRDPNCESEQGWRVIKEKHYTDEDVVTFCNDASSTEFLFDVSDAMDALSSKYVSHNPCAGRLQKQYGRS